MACGQEFGNGSIEIDILKKSFHDTVNNILAIDEDNKIQNMGKLYKTLSKREIWILLKSKFQINKQYYKLASNNKTLLTSRATKIYKLLQ